MKSVFAVLAGAVLWAVLWLGLNQLLLAVAPATFSAEQPITSAAALLAMWVASVAFSVLAGYVTGAVARAHEVAHASALGVLQVGIGIFFQLQYWELMPVWYHVLFLICLFPANVYGGVLRRRRPQRSA